MGFGEGKAERLKSLGETARPVVPPRSAGPARRKIEQRHFKDRRLLMYRREKGAKKCKCRWVRIRIQMPRRNAAQSISIHGPGVSGNSRTAIACRRLCPLACNRYALPMAELHVAPTLLNRDELIPGSRKSHMTEDLYRMALETLQRHLEAAEVPHSLDDGDIVGGHRLSLSVSFENFVEQQGQVITQRMCSSTSMATTAAAFGLAHSVLAPLRSRRSVPPLRSGTPWLHSARSWPHSGAGRRTAPRRVSAKVLAR